MPDIDNVLFFNHLWIFGLFDLQENQKYVKYSDNSDRN